MSNYLCKVAEVFQLTGRLVVVSDAAADHIDTRKWRHGSKVELRRPDGSIVTTKTWYELGSPTEPNRPISFSVEDSLAKADIPQGTEVWLLE